MFEHISRDRMVVQFAGARAGTEPLTWGQKAIFQDMQDSGNQFSMGGRLNLPDGSTVDDAAARLRGLAGSGPSAGSSTPADSGPPTGPDPSSSDRGSGLGGPPL